MQEETTVAEVGTSLELEQTSGVKKIVVGALFTGDVYAYTSDDEKSLRGVSIEKLLERRFPYPENKNLARLCVTDQSLDVHAIAKKLIKNNGKAELISIVGRLSESQQRAVFSELLTDDTIDFTLENVSVFSSVTSREIITEVIARGFSRALVRNILMFPTEERTYIQEAVVRSGELGAIVDNISALPEVTHDWIIETLVDDVENQKPEVLERIKLQMDRLEFSDTALAKLKDVVLLQTNDLDPTFLLDFPSIFPDVDAHAVVSKLINRKMIASITSYYFKDKVKGIDDTGIVLCLLEESNLSLDSVASFFGAFKEFDSKQVLAYLQERQAYTIINHFYVDKFAFFPKKELYESLYASGGYEEILDTYFSFKEFIDHELLFQAMLANEKYHPLLIEESYVFMTELGHEYVIGLLVQHQIFEALVDSFVIKDNYDLVLKTLQEYRCYDIIASSYIRFPTVDHMDLFENLLTLDEVRLKKADNFLSVFMRRETRWCLLKLFSLNKHAVAARYFSYFDRDTVKYVMNKNEIQEAFLAHGQGKVLLDNPSLFTTIDPYALTAVVVKEGKVETEKLLELITYLTKEQKLELVSTLIANGQLATVAVHIHHFLELGQDFVTTILGNFTAVEQTLLLKNYVNCRNNDALLALLERSEVKLIHAESEFVGILEELRHHLAHENYSEAKKVFAIIEKLFPQKVAALVEVKQTLKTKRESDQSEVPRRGFNSLQCLPEMYRYYLILSLKKKYGQVFDATGVGKRLNKEISALFDKVREYTIVAVAHELENDQKKGDLLEMPVPDRRIFNRGSSEAIRVFFHQAASKFTANFAKGSSFGGEAWALIAEHGEKLWSDKATTDVSEQTTLLNLAISLHHNSGTYFDKDRQRVKLEQTKVHNLLKFEAGENRSFSDFTEYGAVEEILTKDSLDEFSRLDNFLSKMEAETGVQSVAIRGTVDKFVEDTRQSLFRRIEAHPTLPYDVKLFAQTVYTHEGFSRGRNGPILLGRLAKNLNIPWTKNEGYVKEFSTDTDKVIFLDVQGFAFAFWYKGGKQQTINSLQELKQSAPELEKVFGRTIVPAHYGYTKEGD